METPEQIGFFLTAEELAATAVLGGGQCEFADSLGIERIEDQEQPTFDIGFRSLLARGLVRISGDSVLLSPIVKDVGEALVDPTAAWGVGIGYEQGSEAAGFIGLAGGTLTLVPGPPGVFSVRPTEAEPIDVLIDTLQDLSASFSGADEQDGAREALAFVQQFSPNVSSTARVLVGEDGGFSIVEEDGAKPVPDEGLRSYLLKATSSS